ncbi:unnamed protein product, partial [Arctogadus glacialis]
MRDEKFNRVSFCVEIRRLLRRTGILSAQDARVKRRVQRSLSETGMELIIGRTGKSPSKPGSLGSDVLKRQGQEQLFLARHVDYLLRRPNPLRRRFPRLSAI